MTWPGNHPISEAQRAAWRDEFAESDAALGFEIGDDFVPFTQRDDIFSRAQWDPAVRSEDSDAFFASYRAGAVPRRGQGFSQKDFALRNAAWAVSDIISGRAAHEGAREGFGAPIRPDTALAKAKAPVDDVAAQTAEIKRLARLFGADLVGITKIDSRWHYSSRVDNRDMSEADNTLPESVTHVIVMGHAMDYDLVATYPSALAGASTGLEYSHETAICIQLSGYIRALGYEAVASMNDTALVIPYAIKAGLGEYGRNQMVLTPEFGPRVRFSKIFTSLPLVVDQPRKMGLKDYCRTCTKCAVACPPKALPMGAPQTGRDSRSTIKGVTKWSANCEKCFGYWAKLKTDCAICMRVCPFNRRNTGWRDRLWRWLATGRARVVARAWDQRRGRDKPVKPRDWWARLTRG